jgi:hypothetical protein
VIACAGSGVDQDGGEEAPQAGAEVEVHVDDITKNGSAEDGVGKPVADIAHSSEDDIDAEQPAQAPDKRGGDEASHEELILERF